MINKDISVQCLKYGESFLPESMVFDGGSSDKQIPIAFAIYLIKTDNRNILVDAGCDTMPGFDMRNFYSPAVVLKEAGLSADEVTDVIITHSHHDHIEAVKHFKNAVIYISKLEYENGKKYIPSDFKVVTFEKGFSIGERIKVIEYGGHSEGSLIVEIAAENVTHVIAGDECYTNANIEHKICTGLFHNKEKSKEFVEKYSDKKYCVHTCHDMTLETGFINLDN